MWRNTIRTLTDGTLLALGLACLLAGGAGVAFGDEVEDDIMRGHCCAPGMEAEPTCIEYLATHPNLCAPALAVCSGIANPTEQVSCTGGECGTDNSCKFGESAAGGKFCCKCVVEGVTPVCNP
jgi:hypothetical protein